MSIQHTKENEQIILSHLTDREFRLRCGMYKLINEKGELVPLKMFPVQEDILDNMHDKNIYLKSRQHGVTTFLQIYILDEHIFGGKYGDSAVIAHKREDAQKFFNLKIKVALSNLPDFIHEQIRVRQDTHQVLSLDNSGPGERETLTNIYVTTSARSGTISRCLHISEFGYLSTFQPAKALEVKAGSLNTLHAGSKLFIESTAYGPVGDFHEYCRTAQKLKFQGTPLSRFDMKFFFFSWFQDNRNQQEPPEGAKNWRVSDDMVRYFDELQDATGVQLTIPQKYWYVKKSNEQGRLIKQEHPSTPEEAFEAIIEGAVYGDKLQKVTQENRLLKVPYDKEYPVYTSWDLGRSKGNAMSIVFFQYDGLYYRYIDYYYKEFINGLEEPCEWVNKRPYAYGGHFGPWDIGVKDLSAGGKTRAEMCLKWGIEFVMRRDPKKNQMVSVVGKTDPVTRYEAGREHMDICLFDVDNCADREEYRGNQSFTHPGLITSLQNYRHEYDEHNRIYKPEPVHDWASNLADAFGQSAQVREYVDKEFKKGRRQLLTGKRGGWKKTSKPRAAA